MTTPSVSKPNATDAASEPRWGMWTAMITAWLLPATTASRTQHLPLRRAFVAHLLAAATAMILLMIISVIADSYPVLTSHLALDLFDAPGFLILDLQRDPSGTILSLLGHGLAVEGGCLALAVLVMPWGARDERVGQSFRHASRRVWLQSTHAIPILLLVGGVTVAFARAENSWWRTHRSPSWLLVLPMAPNLIPDDPGYADAKRDYEAAVGLYYQQYLKHRLEIDAWSRTVPWYVGPPTGVIPSVTILASLWGLWALIRALGADRTVPRLTRAPTCDVCGYALTGLLLEGRCPECGEPIEASLGPDTRSGTIWERRAEVGRLQAWWRCFRGTLIQPWRFGRQLRLVSPKAEYRYFFALHLVLIFSLGAGVLACEWAAVTYRTADWNPVVPLAAGVIFGGSSAIGAVLLTGVAALLGGAWHGFRGRRNLMSGTIQVTCYLSGYLTLCFVFAVVSGTAVVTLYYSSFYADWARVLRIDDTALAFYGWLVPNVLCLTAYFVLVVRGTRGIRYANR